MDTRLRSRVLLKPMEFGAERLASPGDRSRVLGDQGEEAARTVGGPSDCDFLGKRLFVYGGPGHVEIMGHASNSTFARYSCQSSLLAINLAKRMYKNDEVKTGR